MQIIRIAGTTRTIGKAQGYLGLPLRDIVVDDPVSGPTAAMETAWEPTPDELAALNAGAPIILCVLGSGHPPVMLRTGDLPEDAEPDRPFCYVREDPGYIDPGNGGEPPSVDFSPDPLPGYEPLYRRPK